MNPTNQSNKPLSYFTVATCLLAATGLAIELFLISHGKSLCQTSACEIVAKYVRFGEATLLAAGTCFFLLLAGAVFFCRRYFNNPLIAKFPLLLLVGSAAFDGALIGFQFVTLGQKCAICLMVAATLISVGILYSASLRKWSIALLCISAWVAGFIANSVLIMPDVTVTNSGMVFYERDAAEKIKNPATATLIFSLNCPHCKDVLKLLAEKNPNDMKWRFAIVDGDKDIITKLGLFYDNAADSDNPFKLLLETKDKDIPLPPKILDKFPDLTRQARIFLSNIGITGIPVLVIDITPDKKIILTGTKEITNYLATLTDNK